MKNIDSFDHVRGKSVYVDDLPVVQDTLFASVLYSTSTHATIKIDASPAMIPGVVKIITAKDVPYNQIGNIIPDEPLLAENMVFYRGEPIAIVLAKTQEIANHARELINVEYDKIPVITYPKLAVQCGLLIHDPKIIEYGSLNWEKCDFIVENTIYIGGQEHLYLETQAAYAFPQEKDRIKIISSTQSPTVVQKAAAHMLKKSMHDIEVEIIRLGGAFGGKEDQATPVACMAALGTYLTKRPVKLVYSRHDDMIITGKRHPYIVDYRIGADKSGKIINWEVIFYQNSGAFADLSPAVLERTMFHATNSYYIPNVRIVGVPTKTNLPPFTAFRGFGGPQGIFSIESALFQLSRKMRAEGVDISYYELQTINQIKDGQRFPYGQIMKNCTLDAIWKKIDNKYKTEKENVTKFNKEHKYRKRGIASFPLTFGISFTKTSLNQGSALIHIYSDGSVGISTGAVEMGQGVNTRMIQTVAQVFSIPPEWIRIETTNTTRVANASPSAASSTHDLNGKALINAANKLINRLSAKAAQILNIDQSSISFFESKIGTGTTNISWNDLITQSYESRIDLSAHGYYATPTIHFNPATGKGHPFSYYAFGAGIVIVELDVIRGVYKVISVDVFHDVGKSLNYELDLGQMEGGIVQGLGWTLLEELIYDNSVLASNSLGTYKIPGLDFVPQINIEFIENNSNENGLFHSKAIGEPPFFYGIPGYFALSDAIIAFNPNYNKSISLPYTPEKVLFGLWD